MRRPHLPIVAAWLLAACGPDDPPDASPDAPPEAAPPSTDIFLAALEPSGDSLLLGEPANLTRRPGYDNQPAFLASGDAFLYTVVDDRGRADVWRYDLTSGVTEPVTRTPASEYSPTPLPRGSGFSAVRVEADSTQRLWRFDMDGRGAALVLEDVAPVGYHAWLDSTTVALFVLGDPPTLQIADVRTGAVRRVAEGIGRSIQPIPGMKAVSYVRIAPDGQPWIARWGPDTEGTLTAAAGSASDDHAWTPGGGILQADRSRVLWWSGREGEPWRLAADLGPSGLEVTRLAVHPDGRRVLLVAGLPPD